MPKFRVYLNAEQRHCVTVLVIADNAEEAEEAAEQGLYDTEEANELQETLERIVTAVEEVTDDE